MTISDLTIHIPAPDFSAVVEHYQETVGNRGGPPWLHLCRVDPLPQTVEGITGDHAQGDRDTFALSADYAARINAFRETLGITLDLTNEGPPPPAHEERPFPHSLGQEQGAYWTLMNEHIAYRLARTGARSVLEVGAGYFSLTRVLQSHGFDVQVVEPNPYADVYMEMQGIRVPLLNHGFEDVPESAEEVDCVVFMESFHHMLDPTAALRRALELAPRVMLCAEPITNDPSIVPYPWGPRLDGPSMFAMLALGWNENGFQPNFIRVLARSLDAEIREWRLDDLHHSNIIELQLP